MNLRQDWQWFGPSELPYTMSTNIDTSLISCEKSQSTVGFLRAPFPWFSLALLFYNLFMWVQVYLQSQMFGNHISMESDLTPWVRFICQPSGGGGGREKWVGTFILPYSVIHRTLGFRLTCFFSVGEIRRAMWRENNGKGNRGLPLPCSSYPLWSMGARQGP